MDGHERDRQLLQELVRFTGKTPAYIAREINVAATTINRPYSGTATTRLSRSTIDKLQARFPNFPGWTELGFRDRQLPFRGAPREDVELAALSRKAAREPEMVEVAGIDLNFGLGGAFMDQDIAEHHAERLPFPRAWLRQVTTSDPDQLYWTRGVGNSMEPAISDGDVILIDRSKVGSSFGDLYWAIAYGQTGMIKRLRPMPDGSVKILSDNANVPPEIAYDGEVHVFGRVVAVVKRV